MTLGQCHDTPLGHGQKLCEIFRSNEAVRSYGPGTDYRFVCSSTLTLEIWPWVKVMTHPLGHGQQLCEILSRSEKGVRSYGPDTMWTDGRTVRRTDIQTGWFLNPLPPNFVCEGYKNSCLFLRFENEFLILKMNFYYLKLFSKIKNHFLLYENKFLISKICPFLISKIRFSYQRKKSFTLSSFANIEKKIIS